jgi:hypothetical protein
MIVMMIAHIMRGECSQIATSIDEKICIGDILDLDEQMKERCPGASPGG